MSGSTLKIPGPPEKGTVKNEDCRSSSVGFLMAFGGLFGGSPGRGRSGDLDPKFSKKSSGPDIEGETRELITKVMVLSEKESSKPSGPSSGITEET